MFRYFAYGSVLSPSHAREWCDSHGMDVTPFLKGDPATLEGYRLAFRVPSRFWQGLVADLAPDPAGHVRGVVFTLDDSAHEAVMRKEGVATGLYRDLPVRVTTASGVVEALAFEAVPDRRGAEGPASSRYVDGLIEGATARGLGDDWGRTLNAVARDVGKPPPPGVTLGMKR